MKESIGGSQLFTIVIIIVLLFAAIMALTINHSNAFAVKDQIITIIEKNNGIDLNADLSNNPALQEIANSLVENAYRQTGKCSNIENADVYAFDRQGDSTDPNNASFCIIRNNATDKDGTITTIYYKVEVFYHLDIPILKQIINLKVTGETKALTK